MHSLPNRVVQCAAGVPRGRPDVRSAASQQSRRPRRTTLLRLNAWHNDAIHLAFSFARRRRRIAAAARSYAQAGERARRLVGRSATPDVDRRSSPFTSRLFARTNPHKCRSAADLPETGIAVVRPNAERLHARPAKGEQRAQERRNGRATAWRFAVVSAVVKCRKGRLCRLCRDAAREAATGAFVAARWAELRRSAAASGRLLPIPTAEGFCRECLKKRRAAPRKGGIGTPFRAAPYPH